MASSSTRQDPGSRNRRSQLSADAKPSRTTTTPAHISFQVTSMTPVRNPSVAERRVRPVDKRGKMKEFWGPNDEKAFAESSNKFDAFKRERRHGHGRDRPPTATQRNTYENEVENDADGVDTYRSEVILVTDKDSDAQKGDVVIIVDPFLAKKQGDQVFSDKPVRAVRVHDFSGSEIDINLPSSKPPSFDKRDPMNMVSWALQYTKELKNKNEQINKTGMMPDDAQDSVEPSNSEGSEQAHERLHPPTTFMKPEQAPHLEKTSKRVMNIIRSGYTDHVSPETQADIQQLKKKTEKVMAKCLHHINYGGYLTWTFVAQGVRCLPSLEAQYAAPLALAVQQFWQFFVLLPSRQRRSLFSWIDRCISQIEVLVNALEMCKQNPELVKKMLHRPMQTVIATCHAAAMSLKELADASWFERIALREELKDKVSDIGNQTTNALASFELATVLGSLLIVMELPSQLKQTDKIVQGVRDQLETLKENIISGRRQYSAQNLMKVRQELAQPYSILKKHLRHRDDEVFKRLDELLSKGFSTYLSLSLDEYQSRLLDDNDIAAFKDVVTEASEKFNEMNRSNSTKENYREFNGALSKVYSSFQPYMQAQSTSTKSQSPLSLARRFSSRDRAREADAVPAPEYNIRKKHKEELQTLRRTVEGLQKEVKALAEGKTEGREEQRMGSSSWTRDRDTSFAYDDMMQLVDLKSYPQGLNHVLWRPTKIRVGDVGCITEKGEWQYCCNIWSFKNSRRGLYAQLSEEDELRTALSKIEIPLPKTAVTTDDDGNRDPELTAEDLYYKKSLKDSIPAWNKSEKAKRFEEKVPPVVATGHGASSHFRHKNLRYSKLSANTASTYLRFWDENHELFEELYKRSDFANKEETVGNLSLIVATLQAEYYALFISDLPTKTTINFERKRKVGQPWLTMTPDLSVLTEEVTVDGSQAFHANISETPEKVKNKAEAKKGWHTCIVTQCKMVEKGGRKQASYWATDFEMARPRAEP